ncbi:hypothetical protein NQZ68_002025 [Xyrichtys novacula]|uniref:Uncharacterized protein n=1 Tax=Xyrichtys novacula TaxID=13765 RepID=A0AAV1HB53_XYRNO|nr:hypothetical protein NQZ68_002025 [Xyrichtys novacula]
MCPRPERGQNGGRWTLESGLGWGPLTNTQPNVLIDPMPSYFRTSVRRRGAARRDRQSAVLKELERGEEEGEEEEWMDGWMEGEGAAVGSQHSTEEVNKKAGGTSSSVRHRMMGSGRQSTNAKYQASEMQSDSQGGFHVSEVRPGSPARCPDQDHPFGSGFSEIQQWQISMLSSKWQSTKTSIKLLIEETVGRAGGRGACDVESVGMTELVFQRVLTSLLRGSNVSVCVGQQGLSTQSAGSAAPQQDLDTGRNTGRGQKRALAQVLRGPLIFNSQPRPQMPSQSVGPPSRHSSGLDTLQLWRHKLA